MIFATSTPVLEGKFTPPFDRFNKEIERYNAVACEIVKRHGMQINDLYTLMSSLPESYHSDQTHFYTKEGKEVITKKVLSEIEKSLDIKALSLDFDKICEDEIKVVGL
ncbi:MAG: hypothetical protein IJQ28_02105 [Clostridia bacterium]|nr:hypothetical protein [Clostridia bacterium]